MKKPYFDDEEYRRKEKLEKQNKRVCKHCGHKQTIHSEKGKRLCTECGHWVFRNDKAEFEFRMNEKLKKK